jgi:hypothetical protein
MIDARDDGADRAPGAGSSVVTKARQRFSLIGLDFFWIWGLGLLILAPVQLSNLLARNQGKRLDALAWILVGVGLPLASAWLARRLRPTTILAQALGFGALLFAALYLVTFLANSADNLIGLLFGGVECWLFFRVLKIRASPQTERIGGKLVFALVVLFAWAGDLSLVWWSNPYHWLVGSPWAVTVTVATSVLVFSAFWTNSGSQVARSIYHRCLLGTTAVVILIASFYPIDLSVFPIYHHWSFYIGSAQLVRGGGVLLWNVPSQYGFLSILLLAYLPMRSLWSALYLLNGIANLVMALCFVGMGWLILRAFLQRVAVSLLVICAMFLRSGLAAIYVGTNYYPSTGGYRFLWLALVMFIFLWGTHRYGVKGFPRSLLYLSSVLWVVSVLWSAESMFFTSVVFIPGFLFITLAQEDGAHRRWLRRAIVPAGMLLAAMIVIVGGYQASIGHPPDPYLYFQYLLAYNAGFAFLPVAFLGPAWILFLVAVSVSTFALALRRVRFSVVQKFWLLILALAAFGTASYFMASRSHPNNIINISLFVCLPLLLLYALTNERMPSHYLNDLFRLVIPVVVLVLVASSLADATALQAYVHPTGLPRSLTPDQPRVEASLQNLIDRAAVMPNDRIILLSDSMYSTVMPPWRFAADGRSIQDSTPWLPVAPLAQIGLLSSSDRESFLERSGETHRVGGWLIVARRTDEPVWLGQYIDAHYVAVESFQSPDWTATRYAPVDYQPSSDPGPSIIPCDRRPGCLETRQWLGQLVRSGNSARRGSRRGR